MIFQFLRSMFDLACNIYYMQTRREVSYYFKAFWYAIQDWKYVD